MDSLPREAKKYLWNCLCSLLQFLHPVVTFQLNIESPEITFYANGLSFNIMD